MPTYYVHIPDSEAPTAEVNASSTKHARTTYLDYLSRNGIISWRERQSTRSLVRASRMQPGEIRTQVQLDYDMRPEPETVMEEAPSTEGVPATFREGAPDEEVLAEEKVLSDAEKRAEQADQLAARQKWFAPKAQPEQQAQPQAGPFGNSPIIQLSRKSKGM